MLTRYEKLSVGVSEITRLLHKISYAEMRRFGLRGAWAKYLLMLYKHKSGLTAAKICELCGRNKADVSRSLAELEERGIIEKAGKGNYRVKLRLTEQGCEIAEKVNQTAKRAIEFVGKDITAEERDVFYRALDSIVNNLEVLAKEGLAEI